MGYSLTSDTVPQTAAMGDGHLRDEAAAESRQRAFPRWWCRADQVPEFQVQPDPAKLVRAGVTVPDILDAIGRSNMIDSPGLIEANHQLDSQPGDRAGADAGGDLRYRRQDHARRRAHPHRRHRHGGPSVKPVYTMVTANGKPAVLLNINRQPDSNTVDVANAVHEEIERLRKELPHGRGSAALLRPVGHRDRFDRQRARRHSDRPGAGLAHHGAVPARLGHVAGGRAGDSRHHRGHVHRAARCAARTST